MGYSILSRHQIKHMRQVGRLAAETLMLVGESLRPGMTTNDIDTLVHSYTLKNGARPAPLNYGASRGRPGFPKSVCTSVNEVVCHGIPDDRPLEDGDLLNVDVTSVLPPGARGWHGDTNATFYIGEPSPEAKHLVEITRECLELGVSVVRPGAHIGDIGAIIQEHAEKNGCSVVREYTGHGIGRVFHCEPQVCHVGVHGTGVRIKKGMCFTIEPMINLGDWRVELLKDQWTVVTSDRRLSAQFEHTIVVTDNGAEVLTQRPGLLTNSENLPWSRPGKLTGPRAR